MPSFCDIMIIWYKTALQERHIQCFFTLGDSFSLFHSLFLFFSHSHWEIDFTILLQRPAREALETQAPHFRIETRAVRKEGSLGIPPVYQQTVPIYSDPGDPRIPRGRGRDGVRKLGWGPQVHAIQSVVSVLASSSQVVGCFRIRISRPFFFIFFRPHFRKQHTHRITQQNNTHTQDILQSQSPAQGGHRPREPTPAAESSACFLIRPCDPRGTPSGESHGSPYPSKCLVGGTFIPSSRCSHPTQAGVVSASWYLSGPSFSEEPTGGRGYHCNLEHSVFKDTISKSAMLQHFPSWFTI